MKYLTILFSILMVPASLALAEEYYVDASAADGGNGSAAAPFNTIQQAADIMVAGDVCIIANGVYPEFVRPARSGSPGNPIVFRAADPGHQVIITGSDPVAPGDWESLGGNLFRTQLDLELDHENQIFLGEKMLLPARWPNCGDDLLDPELSVMDPGTTPVIIYDQALPEGDWSGARVWIHAPKYWANWTTKVTYHQPGVLHIENVAPYPGDKQHVTREGARYFIYNSLAALDASNEWYYDKLNRYLYIFRPDGALPEDLYYVKRRMEGFNLKGRSRIELEGLRINGSTIDTDGSSRELVLDNLKIYYPYFSTEANKHYGTQTGKGVIVKGAHCRISNCEVAYSSGCGIVLDGLYNFVYNCYVHDTDFIGTYACCIILRGKGNIISHCTLERTGRSLIDYGGMYKALIQFCVMKTCAMLTRDTGLTYGNIIEGGNSEVRYNWMYDNRAEAVSMGLYYDHGTQNIISHHNVIWDIPNHGFLINHYGYYHMAYNNTFSAGVSGFRSTWGNQYPPDLYGCRFYNNVFNKDKVVSATNYAWGHNLLNYKDLIDYKYLPDGSPAIDAGVVLEGINDGYLGEAPDLGAYEHGGIQWVPGHDFENPPPFDTTRTDLVYMNRLENTAFEHENNIRPWRVEGNVSVHRGYQGQGTTDTQELRMGRASLGLGSGAEISQHVTGLEPGALYEFAAFLRADNGASAVIGVRDTRGREMISEPVAGTSPYWQHVILPFNTGGDETDVTVFVRRTSGGGTVFADDCGVAFQEKGTLVYFKRLQTEEVASADTVTWEQVGTGTSGYSDLLFSHPSDPSRLIMSSRGGNTYASVDEGLSWNIVFDGDGSEFPGALVSLDFSGQDPLFGLALDDAGRILKSTNGGLDWSVTNTSLPGRNSCIAADPSDDQRWFIGAGQCRDIPNVHRSQAEIHGNQVEGAEYGHIYKSINGGRGLVKITDQFNPGMDVNRIIVDPRNPDRLYMSTNHGFYMSGNGGDNWKLRGNGLPNNRPRDLCSWYDKSTGEFLLYLLEQSEYADDGDGSVTVSGGVFRSSDGGSDWENITGNLAIDLGAIQDNAFTTGYYRAMAWWFGMEEEEARTSFPELPDSIFTVFNTIAVNPLDKNQVYLSLDAVHDYAFPPGEVWMTRDGGQHWQPAVRHGAYWEEGRDGAYWQGRASPTVVNTAFSHDADRKAGLEGPAGCTFLHTGPGGAVFISLGEQLLRSPDGGVTWAQADDDETSPGSGAWVGRGGSFLETGTLPSSGGMAGTRLFTDREYGIWSTAPGGSGVLPGAQAVKRVTTPGSGPVNVWLVAVHPSDTASWVALAADTAGRLECWVTGDGGVSWTLKSEPLAWQGDSLELISPASLVIDPADPSTLLFCIPESVRDPDDMAGGFRRNGPGSFTGFGVYRSTDGGSSWELSNTGLPPGANVQAIEATGEEPPLLFAALGETLSGDAGGLYRSLDGGVTWSVKVLPGEIRSVNHVHWNRSSDRLYFSAGRKAGSIEEGGAWVSDDGGITYETFFDFPNILETNSSPGHPGVVTVVAGPSDALDNLNAGAFLTRDHGYTWQKVNRGIGLPLQVISLKPDPVDRDLLWCAVAGSGWFRGAVKPGVVARASGASVLEGDSVTLDASGSYGNDLAFEWTFPSGIESRAADQPEVTFMAPEVEYDSVFLIRLTVTDGTATDETGVRLRVRARTGTGYRTMKISTIAVFPNPADHWMMIDGIKEPGLISLYDLNGQQLLTRRVEPGSQVDIAGLHPGFYLGTFTSGTVKHCFKLIKQ